MGQRIFRVCAARATTRSPAVKATTHNAPTLAPDAHARVSSTPDSCKAVTMPAYLIQHAAGQRGDMLIEDPTLTLNIRDGWAVLTDDQGIAVALPTEHVACITRVDEPQDQEPAPRKE